MVHLVIITPIFATDEQDSISLPFLQLFCKELIRKGVALTIISEQFPKHSDYTWNGIKVYTLKKSTPKLFYKFLRKKRLTSCLKKIHASNPINVIHNFWFNILGQISEQFALENKIKHLITLTGQDVLARNPLLGEIKNYSGQLVCPSGFQKLKIQELFPLEPKVIAWGIEEVEPIDKERDIDLIQCGWINSVKNNFQFLEIVQALYQSGHIQKVVICGGGPMFAELQNNIAKLELGTIISTKDSIPRAEVLQLMQQSKILVHTSHFESFGLVLAESLASGCIVVSTPVGIAYDDDEILKCITTDDFVSTIKYQLELNKNQKRNKINRYPIEKTVESYLELYNRQA